MRRALIVSLLPPASDRDGSAGHSLSQGRALHADGWAVTVIAEEARPEDLARMRALGQEGIEVHAGPDCVGFEDAYLEDPAGLISRSEFDLAIVQFWSRAENWIPVLREYSPSTAVLVDIIDLHLLRLIRGRVGGLDGDGGGPLEHTHGGLIVRELNAYLAADGILSASAADAQVVEALTGGQVAAHVVPLARVANHDAPGFEERAGMLFSGNFGHPPNVDALRHLCQDILPLVPDEVRERHPLHVVGYRLDSELAAELAEHAHVIPIGFVPSLTPYLDRARLLLAPLRLGAGVKNKLLDAFAAGLPVVTTEVGVEGMPVVAGQDALVASDPAAFAAAIVSAIDDRERWEALSAAGPAWIERHATVAAQTDALRAAVAAALERPVAVVA